MPTSSSRSFSGIVASSLPSRIRSALSVSACELTDTYSPAAIDIAPATSPAIPVSNMVAGVACAAATPTIRLAVDTMPSFAPRTDARNQPMRSMRCASLCRGILLKLQLKPRPRPSGFNQTPAARQANIGVHHIIAAKGNVGCKNIVGADKFNQIACR